MNKNKYWVIIPALNEEKSIELVLNSLWNLNEKPEKIIVVDNGSSDSTAKVALKMGATILRESKKGYGRSCKKALQWIENQIEKPEIIVFMDGDYSDFPEDIPSLLKEFNNGFQVVIGSRINGYPEKDSLSKIQIFGNKLSCFFMNLLFKTKFTDLGPLRAISYDVLKNLNMQDNNFGWTIELQCKVAIQKIPYIEIPVRYRSRYSGESKVSRNFMAAIQAGFKILSLIFYFYFQNKLQLFSKELIQWKNYPWFYFLWITGICILIHSKIPRTYTFQLLTFYFIAYIILLLPSKAKTMGKFYLFTGFLIRIPFVFLIPTLSDDYYRYIWDANLLLQGINPYLYTPNELIQYLNLSLNSIYQNLNSKDFYSFYPPLFLYLTIIPLFINNIFFNYNYQSIFFYIFFLKLIFLFFELGNLLILKKLLKYRENNLKYYAWNPLIILEGIGNLHFEILVVFFILLFLSLKYEVLKGLSLACAIGVKIYPLTILPKYVMKPKIILPSIVVIILYLYLLNPIDQIHSGFGLYIHTFEFFSLFNYYFRLLIAHLGYDFQELGILPWILAILIIFGFIIYAMTRKKVSNEKFLFFSFSVILFFSPVLHPWYLIPWLTLGIILGYKFPLVGGLLSFASYSYYQQIPFSRNEIIVVVSYLLFFMYLFWELYEYKHSRNRFCHPRSFLRNLS